MRQCEHNLKSQRAVGGPWRIGQGGYVCVSALGALSTTSPPAWGGRFATADAAASRTRLCGRTSRAAPCRPREAPPTPADSPGCYEERRDRRRAGAAGGKSGSVCACLRLALLAPFSVQEIPVQARSYKARRRGSCEWAHSHQALVGGGGGRDKENNDRVGSDSKSAYSCLPSLFYKSFSSSHRYLT